MNTPWLKDRALLLAVGVVAAVFAWSYFRVLGQAGLALMLIAIIAPELITAYRLRVRMQRFAASPEALAQASTEFRQLVAAGDSKQAIALYRQAFGLSSVEAIRAMKALKA
jgi:hypothetical protein